MKEYFIYWIKEEFAYHYFYKNDILQRFLSSYEKDRRRWDLSTQHDYITHKIPRKILMSHLYRNHNYMVQALNNGTQLEVYNHKHYLILHIHEKHITFQCETLYDAEELLFPTLRILQPLLFVMGKTNQEEYGWISPVTKNRKYNSRKILYSYQ